MKNNSLFAAKDSPTNYTKGVKAEDVAAKFLEEKGYKILERRYKTRYGEIDIIALCKTVLCFVEVKTRSSYEEALQAVTPRTCRRIEKSALFFLSQELSYLSHDVRFDVVAITRGGEIWHLDNAWEACS